MIYVFCDFSLYLLPKIELTGDFVVNGPNDVIAREIVIWRLLRELCRTWFPFLKHVYECTSVRVVFI